MDATSLVENLAESLCSVTDSAPLNTQEKLQFNKALTNVDPKLRPTLAQFYKVKKCFQREELELSFQSCSPYTNKAFIDPFRWLSCLRAIVTGQEDAEVEPKLEAALGDGENPSEEDKQNAMLKSYLEGIIGRKEPPPPKNVFFLLNDDELNRLHGMVNALLQGDLKNDSSQIPISKAFSIFFNSMHMTLTENTIARDPDASYGFHVHQAIHTELKMQMQNEKRFANIVDEMRKGGTSGSSRFGGGGGGGGGAKNGGNGGGGGNRFNGGGGDKDGEKNGKICKFWMMGTCSYGAKCRSDHEGTEQQIREKAKLFKIGLTDEKVKELAGAGQASKRTKFSSG